MEFECPGCGKITHRFVQVHIHANNETAILAESCSDCSPTMLSDTVDLIRRLHGVAREASKQFARETASDALEAAKRPS